MAEETFVAYFILNGHGVGEDRIDIPRDGRYPMTLPWQGRTFYLVGEPTSVTGEAHYQADA
jgi:hypothetical protein